MLEVAFIKQTV